ncbi:ArsR/SmtB family transcription factor [Salisediminibacterium selenitireducens]|uniref:Transcriptional regulator, ArsR family n=1 Tax=Bacillus selenitireducens (strain ATCC 700615 / DSM 15326 / MLS10) TaxID=439292 RepID=D6XXN2_BACIE|nr:metalloregulator ArsR/SmtB family transcription factor [Salisediminibacterium selenitireducens]ADI00075.1 transcriptional regulator, ArsR family [[Bacillus] selenitireducens MLS10]
MSKQMIILNQSESRQLLSRLKEQHPGLREDVQRSANVYKALGDPQRLMMLAMILERDCCKCELLDALDGAPSTITHHVNILEKAGLIASRREGKYTMYSLFMDADQVRQWLKGCGE